MVQVSSFVSFCGGLPAPEASDNALRYKFSWSPKGVLLALMNPAKYLYKGKIVDIEGGCGTVDHLYPIDFMPGFSLVGYANRDSTKYSEIYGVQNECKTLLRGTLRYHVRRGMTAQNLTATHLTTRHSGIRRGLEGT